MKLIVASLLYAFDIELLGNQERDFGRQKTFIFWEKEELLVRLKAVAHDV